jgi:hypothetical protein
VRWVTVIPAATVRDGGDRDSRSRQSMRTESQPLSVLAVGTPLAMLGGALTVASGRRVGSHRPTPHAGDTERIDIGSYSLWLGCLPPVSCVATGHGETAAAPRSEPLVGDCPRHGVQVPPRTPRFAHGWAVLTSASTSPLSWW